MLSDVAHIEAINVISTVLVLPILYFQDCVEVHREYARFYRDISREAESITQEALQRFEDALYVFNLEHWYVTAVAVLLASILLGADSLSLSKLLTTPAELDEAKKTVLVGGLLFISFVIYRVKHAKREAHIVMTEFSRRGFSRYQTSESSNS